jgi:CubicO group peptidase (beta-lactamase class C family)
VGELIGDATAGFDDECHRSEYRRPIYGGPKRQVHFSRADRKSKKRSVNVEELAMRSWHTLLRRTLIVLAGLVALSAAGLAVLISMEWTYIRRLGSHPEKLITDIAWYQPREPVAGGNQPALPRVTPDDRGMKSDALETAAKLADAKNASAMLVARTHAVVLERDWRGLGPEGKTNSASMAKTITALLVGIARDEGLIQSLDLPAAIWLPAWRQDARRKITLRYLLQMNSGLQPMGEYTFIAR